ncbi:hypothetical protein HDU97_004153 [Phlyctochytrium planicorne]|nr:hypothetical protein HDU97_004153 [Phlyctochytrium planicorne]
MSKSQRFNEENQPLLTSPPINPSLANLPAGSTVIVVPPGASSIETIKQHIQDRRRTKYIVIISILLIIFFFAPWHGIHKHKRHNNGNHLPPSHEPTGDSDWEKTDYEYPPSDDLDPSLEFENPVKCYPHEAKFPIYPPNGIFDLPTSPFQALAINVTGRTWGRLDISTIEGLGAPKVSVHFHKNKESLKTSISHGLIDGVYGINVTGPSFEETKDKDECVVVAIKIEIPKGSLEFLEEFKIDAEALSISFQVDSDEVGKKVKINNSLGSVRLSGVDKAQEVVVNTKLGSLFAKNIVSETVSLDAVFGSVTLESTTGSASVDVFAKSGSVRAKDITSRSIKLQAHSGSVTLDKASASESIFVFAQSGSVNAASLSGGFESLTLSSNSGSVHANNVSVNKENGTNAKVFTKSGSANVNFNDFYGKFTVTTKSGSIRVKGSDIEFGSKSRKQVEGVRGDDSGKSSLEVSLVAGSATVEFF